MLKLKGCGVMRMSKKNESALSKLLDAVDYTKLLKCRKKDKKLLTYLIIKLQNTYNELTLLLEEENDKEYVDAMNKYYDGRIATLNEIIYELLEYWEGDKKEIIQQIKNMNKGKKEVKKYEKRNK